MGDVDGEFYMVKYNNRKRWNENYAKIPENHFFFSENVIPPYFEYDFVLSQSKYSHYELALKLAKDRNIPLVCLEHTLPTSNFNSDQIKALKSMVGNYNIYISIIYMSKLRQHLDLSKNIIKCKNCKCLTIIKYFDNILLSI
jgi:hypothetical protein